MPTFTAIAFDRLIEPGASKPRRSAPTSMPGPNSRKLGRRISEPPVPAASSKPPPPRPQLKPSLYATPEVTPLPDADAPSSFPPSPYIVNHKRRGPRLLKSFSEADVQAKQEVHEDENGNGNGKSSGAVVSSSAGDLRVGVVNPEPVGEEQVSGVHDAKVSSSSNGGEPEHGCREDEIRSITKGFHVKKVVTFNSERDVESDDFFDPQDSMSVTSNTDGEDNTGAERGVKIGTPGGEFFDAWEELCSDGGTQNSLHDVEAELREMRLSLVMEIEKRKQVEESLNNMQSQWERIRKEFSLVGIVLPADLTAFADRGQLSSDPVDDICQQVDTVRFISNAIGRGTARAEMEKEMEAQLELKNFEISRLLERLHCYETMNREMSQRNQEAVEMARRERQRTIRRQRWIWGSVTTAIVLGTAAIAWSYLPTGKGSTSLDNDMASEHDDGAN